MQNRTHHPRTKRSRLAARSQCDFQLLENRTLMAGTPLTTTLSAGTLLITGTAADDSITVSRSGNTWTVTNGDWSKIIAAAVTRISVNGKAGNDAVTIDPSVAVPATLIGDLGNDTLIGSSGATSLSGGAGDDSLAGGSANDTLSGDAGNDTLAGGSGDNRLLGGTDNDSLRAESGNDWLQGDAGNDTLTGGAGNDSLYGNAGDDSLSGGFGNDFIQGGLGFDTMAGGAGVDTIDYSDHTAAQPIWLSLAGTSDGGMTSEHDTVSADFEIANGGAGADNISGNDNGNTLYGNAGNDTLNAGSGNDKLYGGAGNDALSGHDGNDSIYGGAGDDLLLGQGGDDLLVSVGGGKNTLLVGGDDNDTFWLDSDVTENVADASTDETSRGAVHRISAFANKVTKELSGQVLADPALKGTSVKYRNFKDHPLFAADGPSINDVVQGQLGDCYFLATLGAYARINPTLIRQSIVDFGDGTYGVQFSKAGSRVFYRIDADLPSYSVSTLSYAALGAQGSLWVALFEKAWTYQRTTRNTYASIEAGFMTEVSSALGKSSSWGNVSTIANTLLGTLKAQLDAGQVITVGTGAEPSGSLLVGGHAYTLISITDDGAGGYTVVLRNPWGIDGYACADNVQDGYITLTTAQFGTWAADYAIGAA